MTELTKKDVEERVETLTERERQVFERIVLGHSNGSVARDLGLDERSVEIHRANVMTKNGCTQSFKIGTHGAQLEIKPECHRPLVSAKALI